MTGFNRVILLGNLTRDPEMRVTPSGTQVTNFRLAASRRYRQGEENKEETLFIDVVVFGRQAQNCHQYLRKGRQALVEGRLTMSQWEGDDGVKRNRYQVVANTVQFLSPRGADSSAEDYQEPTQSEPQVDEEPYGDDVPF